MTSTQSNPQIPSSAGPSRLRPVLWLVLVVSGAANIITVPLEVHIVLDSALGLITVAAGVALIVDHYRHRRR